ncbi:ABC transporter substrate-binding protein [Gimesia aquarii]|uniref:Bacterial extracellular solute-binding protein n=1 Tax=Gimesia aquarii TaxID=2527964 RepID=A0A517VW17_9PLAN|nr:ABC transporter substrate-binding protein [Gimesia aquarii]QDT97203.1 Bacterial extracellular solute-binding protein [Gimesia aquarii]
MSNLTNRSLCFCILVLVLVLSGSTSVLAQKENQSDKPTKSDSTKTDSTQTEEEEVTPLPKIEEMQVPSMDDLLKKPPVDWIVLENDRVLIVEPIYPRPNTLQQLDAALKESYSWPKPKSKEEIDEQRKMRAAFNFIQLTLIDEKESPEYQIQRKNVKQVVHHEDQILMRIDELLKSNQLRLAFELLLVLDRKHRDWPGFNQRQQRLLFLEAKDKQKLKQFEIAIAFIEDLHRRSPEYPGLSQLAGEVIDVLIKQSVKEGHFRKGHFFLKRLASMFPRQKIIAIWEESFLARSNTILNKADQQAKQNDYQSAIQFAMDASIVWPINPRLRESLLRYHNRYPVINVGVLETAFDKTPFFLERNSTRRHRKLTQIPLFEVARINQTPQYQSRFFEQWDPTDLGRRADFILRQSYASWESHPTMMAADITEFLRKKITPGNSQYDERFDSYVQSITATSPFTFSIFFDRVPLRTERLLTLPIEAKPLWEAVSTDINSENARNPKQPEIFVSNRFIVDEQTPNQVRYVRAIPEPTGLRDYNLAQINEIRYPNFEKSFQALLLGEVSVLPFLPAKLVSYFQEQEEFNVVQSAIPLSHVLQFNPESKPLKIIELRRALAYAIDRRKILTDTLLHQSQLLNGRLITAPYYTGLQTYNQQVPQREYNFPLAVALAVASQKKLGGNIPTLHMLCDPNPETQEAAKELINAWSQIGMRVTLIPNTPVEAEKKNLNWDIAYRTVTMTEPVMELWPFLTVGKGAQIESLEIFPDWLRLKLIELDEATDWETATALIKRLQLQLYSMAHIVPLWEIDQFHVFRTNIKGYADRPLNFYDNVEQWVVTPVFPNVDAFTQK